MWLDVLREVLVAPEARVFIDARVHVVSIAAGQVVIGVFEVVPVNAWPAIVGLLSILLTRLNLAYILFRSFLNLRLTRVEQISSVLVRLVAHAVTPAQWHVRFLLLSVELCHDFWFHPCVLEGRPLAQLLGCLNAVSGGRNIFAIQTGQLVAPSACLLGAVCRPVNLLFPLRALRLGSLALRVLSTAVVHTALGRAGLR